jgi:hypothetical protein
VATALALLARGDENRIGGLGLVNAVHPVVGGCLAVLLICFVIELNGRMRKVVLGQLLVGIIVILYAAPALVETEPRFATAYAHAGFVEYISRTGHTLGGFDARFSWPGFFAAAAALVHLTGLSSAVPLLAWAPMLMELLYLPPLLLIGRQIVPDPRGRALGVLIFYLCNWVGQDYFAPQAVAYLFYLVVLAILLTWFRPPVTPDAEAGLGRPGASADVGRQGGDPGAGRRGPMWWLTALPARALRVLGPAARDQPAAPVWVLRTLLVAVVLIVVAMTASHQLTPFALAVAVGIMVIFGICALRSLPLLIAVLVLAWLSFAATDFWVGHFRDVAGSVGDVGGNVTANVGNRIQGSEVHRLVLTLRLVLTGAVWSAAAWTILRPARRVWAHPSAFVLAAAPFLVLALNSYGGEVIMRVYLYSLPFMSILAAQAVWHPGWRAPGWHVRRGFPVFAAAVLLAMGTLFPIARYGNERFEMIRPGEFAALAYVYDHAPPGATILSISGSLPWRYRDMERYAYGSALPYLYPLDLERLESQLRSDTDGSFLVVTRSQIYELQDNQDVSPAWAADVSRRLHTARTLRVVYESDSAYVVAPASDTTPGGKAGR